MTALFRRFPVLSWHRPLMLLAVAMALLVVWSIGGMIVDDRTVTGLPIWAKSAKFALSVLIYAVTWAWLLNQLTRWRRAAWWAGTVAALGLAIELVVITTQIVRGTTSHFNFTTPLNAALWELMGSSIVVVWLATLVVSAALFVHPTVDRARDAAIRYGAALSLAGAALGILMVAPTPEQRAADSAIRGAHTVGVSDGGPGLPLLGWSTVGGDLRIPHFIGMHALQVIPLVLLAVEYGSRRFPVLRAPGTRRRLVVISAATYAALLAVLTWQALRGQSVVHPDATTLAAFAAVALAAAVAAVVAIRPKDAAVRRFPIGAGR
ncbi:hypothetical protein [Nocardia sputorum]|uniref:Uncharacterized protein n=1 Tax=Nocardia sputorum TaxID=2984338 RepID=A0ABN6TZ84_9NOCA|nr:hypothetical protein [Nocardia sputorum]BDT96453.1 hypothetical protein IFM12275_64290 [Nocardia sputorum]BDT98207.1 hypothetical protein IFM12276_12360 [Nocardia sputorum]